jgi:phospholipase/carboxylesterase
MNRFDGSGPSSFPSSQAATACAAAARRRMVGETVFLDPRPLDLGSPGRIFMPQGYEPNYAYPLVIWFHSCASSEWELDGVASSLSLRNYVAMALRGNRRDHALRNLFGWQVTETGVAQVEEMLFEAIDGLKSRLQLNGQAIFLAGYGSGATMAQAVGLRNPQQFAGVIAIEGSMPRLPRLLTQWEAVRTLPIVSMHGQSESSAMTSEAIEFLRFAQMAHLKAYPAMFPGAQGLDSTMLQIADRFMMQRVRGETVNLFETVG